MNAEYPLIAIVPDPLGPGVVAPDNGPIYGLNKTKLHYYAKMNCLN